MEIQFSCQCGDMVEEFTRGETSSDVRVQCDACAAIYVVTITQLTESHTAGGGC